MTNKLLLICGESEESIKTKEFLDNKNIPYKEFNSSNGTLSLIVPGMKEVFRGYENIERYVNSLNSKKKSA